MATKSRHLHTGPETKSTELENSNGRRRDIIFRGRGSIMRMAVSWSRRNHQVPRRDGGYPYAARQTAASERAFYVKGISEVVTPPGNDALNDSAYVFKPCAALAYHM